MNIRTLPLALAATAALAAVLAGCGGPAAHPTPEHTPTPGSTTTTGAPGKVSATAFGPKWSDVGPATAADLKPIGPCGVPVFAKATGATGLIATAPGGEKVVAATIVPGPNAGEAALKTALQYCGAISAAGRTLTSQTVPLPGLVGLTTVTDGAGRPQAVYGYTVTDTTGGKLQVVLVTADAQAKPGDVGLYAQAVSTAYADAAAGRKVARVPALGEVPGDPFAPDATAGPSGNPLDEAPPVGYGKNTDPEFP